MQFLYRYSFTAAPAVKPTAQITAMQAAAESAVAKWIDGKTVVKAICVPGKLVNLVVK